MKSPALAALAANLKRLVGRGRDQEGSSTIGPKAGVDPKTLTNWREGRFGRQGPSLLVVEKVAHLYRMEVWQILLPEVDNRVADLARVYRNTDAIGRTLLEVAMEAARQRTGPGTGKSRPHEEQKGGVSR